MRYLHRRPAELEHGDECHEVVELDVLRGLVAADALVEDEGEGEDDADGSCGGEKRGIKKLMKMKMTVYFIYLFI